MSRLSSPQNDTKISAGNVGESSASSRQEISSRKPWRRFAAFALLVQSTLFWQGCEQNQMITSLGLAGPAVTVGSGESAGDIHWKEGSLLFALVNLAVLAAAAVTLANAPPRWTNRLASTRWLVAVALTTAVFNSILYFPFLWIWAVATPTIWLADTLFRTPGDNGQLILGTISRLYYLVGIAAIWGVLSLVRLVSRRYLFVAPDRWQFSLAGLLAVMVLLGTGLGMLLRLFVT
jgi:hypothetical protein